MLTCYIEKKNGFSSVLVSVKPCKHKTSKIQDFPNLLQCNVNVLKTAENNKSPYILEHTILIWIGWCDGHQVQQKTNRSLTLAKLYKYHMLHSLYRLLFLFILQNPHLHPQFLCVTAWCLLCYAIIVLGVYLLTTVTEERQTGKAALVCPLAKVL